VDIGKLTVGELLESIAAREPVPGGGAVAALTTALAAALGRMVVEFSRGKTSAGHEALHAEALATLSRLQSAAVELADADAAAFAKLAELWKLKRDDERRRSQWPDAVAAAIDAPRRVMVAALEALDLLERISETTGANIRSDLAISALLAQAGAEAAACNVRINLPLVEDCAGAQRLEAETAETLDQAARLRSAVDQACRS
jgi:formiminotetrahydrofolate cyclodeaminase